MSVSRARVLLWAALLWPCSTHAQDLADRFNLKVYATGLYAAEQQLGKLPMSVGREAQVASPYELGYGELRAVLDARRLPGRFDLHLDGRLRLSGQFSTAAATVGADQIVTRGSVGKGREYELRELWARRRGDAWDVGMGRILVAEADSLKLDGARLWWRMAKHWDASLYGGAYPDPFSRSLLTDYVSGLALSGGASATYTYDKIWGSFSLNGAYLGGKDDGGPLDPGALATGPVAGVPRRETPRSWLTFTDYIRLLSWLDLFTDLVVDVTGAAGAQLTRLDARVTARAGQHVTFHLGYDHLSSLAIEMWLTRLLASRVDHQANTIENNLVVERTARDEVSGDVDVHFGQASFYADGRVRKRAVVSLQDDPQFAAAGTQVAPGLAWDTTVGLRDRGTLAGLRAGLWATYLADYRAQSVLFGVEVGRGLFDDRIDLKLSFLYANTKDHSASDVNVPGCDATLVSSFKLMQPSCYGRRAGSEYELGATVAGTPFAHWFAFVDYRLVADLTDGKLPGTMLAQPTLLTHLLLVRIEARY